MQDPPLAVSGVIPMFKERCDPTPEKGLPLFLQGGDCIEKTIVEAGITDFKYKKIAALKFKCGYQNHGKTGVTARHVQVNIRIHIKCTIIKRVQKKVSCMKTIGIRALRENPGVLSQCAERGELILVTNRNNPISLSVPFSDELLQSDIGVSMAVKLFEEGVLTLPKSAKLAKMSIEEFLLKLAALGVIVVDQTTKELKSDLGAIRGKQRR